MLFRLDRGGDDATSLPPGWHSGELEPLFPALARATACFWHGRVACGGRTLVILSGTQPRQHGHQPYDFRGLGTRLDPTGTGTENANMKGENNITHSVTIWSAARLSIKSLVWNSDVPDRASRQDRATGYVWVSISTSCATRI